MQRNKRNHINKRQSLRGARMLKLSIGCLTTRQSSCTTWDVDQRPIDGALISFSGMESFLGLFSQPGAFVSFGGPKERGEF
ncbi:hypothetical protein ACKGJO_14645 [Gracilimonas sp. Q87]|uniref:hypothetical protein n=1 Tax=Gracilimonas sp. Q87 TaxID=3384766 RepID=UPI0039843DDE